MNSTKNIIYLCLLALFANCTSQESVKEPIIVKPTTKVWKLVYEDEFNGTAYDTKY